MENKIYDIIVCGGGPAGICAALSAAEHNMSVLIIEQQNCLGGIWTSGLLTWILDIQNKDGYVKKIISNMIAADKGRFARGNNFFGESEGMKLILEDMAINANVDIRYNTIVEGIFKNGDAIEYITAISKSGKEKFYSKMFIDATGDGDVGYLSGCEYEMGHPDTGETQPMSLIALFCGVPYEKVMKFDNALEYLPGKTPKKMFYEEVLRGGYTASLSDPAMFHIHNDLYLMMVNHEYGYKADNADDITKATINARKEVNMVVDSLKSIGDPWQNIKLVSTAQAIGVREGRRIKGLYGVTKDDLINGKKHKDCICKARFGMDVHSLNKEVSTSYYHNGGVSEYDIPLRALISKDVSNLMMAGRCISGDFYAHSSYRVTGNATIIGEAAGKYAAYSVNNNILARDIDFDKLEDLI